MIRFSGRRIDELIHDDYCFQAKYSKTYKNRTEENRHMRTFLKHKAKVEEHNEKYNEGLVSYTMSLNSFSDIENSDFAAVMKEIEYIRSQAPM